jgi:hypothetical protein
MKLTVDVQKSTISGLESEKNHQALELQETKELLAIFEAKSAELVKELSIVSTQLNSNKREMINFNQSNGEKDEKIAFISTELSFYKAKSEDLSL